MVKLLLKQFRKVESEKEKLCNYCELVIKPKTTHYKHDDQNWIRLHVFCYSHLALEGIQKLADKLQSINTGEY